MFGWIVAGLFGVFVGSKVIGGGGASKPAVDEPPAGPEIVYLWRGTVGDVRWQVGSLGRTNFAWHVEIPESQGKSALHPSGAEPDLGSALKAAMRTSIELGGSLAAGNITGASLDGAMLFSVTRGADGWTWSTSAESGRVQVSGTEQSRGAAVIAALDQVGRSLG